ncbi:hypothetical protein LX32DRAFT_197565 [Colletotrichum zoysiae]|uniref:Uncharacterized protein n=1 Tax=Colletotrichum zoysiae TaxID=1216348 RepID=A0AAD9HR69_9PEZI|nr:hypothetical protein LX32DRAFT_197565 [Colletotrichum zoysiae]
MVSMFYRDRGSGVKAWGGGGRAWMGAGDGGGESKMGRGGERKKDKTENSSSLDNLQAVQQRRQPLTCLLRTHPHESPSRASAMDRRKKASGELRHRGVRSQSTAPSRVQNSITMPPENQIPAPLKGSVQTDYLGWALCIWGSVFVLVRLGGTSASTFVPCLHACTAASISLSRLSLPFCCCLSAASLAPQASTFSATGIPGKQSHRTGRLRRKHGFRIYGF